MRKYIIESLLIIFILFIQMLFNFYMGIWELKPDFLLIFIISISLSVEIKKSLILGAFTGFFEDLFSGGILGLFLLSKVTLAYVLSYIKDSLKGEYLTLLIPIIVFLGSLSVYEIELIFARILHIGSYNHLFIIKLSFINFLFSPISYIFIKLIRKIEEEK